MAAQRDFIIFIYSILVYQYYLTACVIGVFVGGRHTPGPVAMVVQNAGWAYGIESERVIGSSSVLGAARTFIASTSSLIITLWN